MNVFLLVLLITINSTCFAVRIVGGLTASKGQFPWQAAINITTTKGKHFCGGSVVHARWILTAARCVQEAQEAIITLGSVRIDAENAVTTNAVRFVLHEQYDRSGVDFDVGLILVHPYLRLNDIYNDGVIIDKINLPGEEIQEGAYVLAAGWGATNSNSSKISRDLNYVPLKTISNNDCNDIYGSGTIPDVIVCGVSSTENIPRGICDNDNGGPLVVNASTNATLVGISSFFSRSGCDYGDPSGFLRIFPYTNWIREVINDNNELTKAFYYLCRKQLLGI